MSDLQNNTGTAKIGFFKKVDNYFGVSKNGSNIRREILAGLTTFFTMAYIIFVNPNILSATGMNWQAVFLATIIATIVGTMVMALFANVPYAQAPGMGLNAFFAFTVCDALGFAWQEALFMVFLCGVINIILTITRVRKMLFNAIPKSLQYAISGGIGIFIAYIGLFGSGLIDYSGLPDGVPALATFNSPAVIITMGGIILIVALLLLKVKGAILIGIITSTLVTVILCATNVIYIEEVNLSLSNLNNISPQSWGESFSAFGETFGAAFGNEGMLSLFSDVSKLPIILVTIFAFSVTDIFDTIGTLIGTGRKSGIFTEEEEKALMESKGFKTRMDKTLFADSIATSIGALLGTSNVTTYVESAAGIEEGGRTGLTSVVTSILFALCILIAPIAGLVPTVATAPALIVVGVMMISAFKNINWEDFAEAVPALFAGVVMAFSYSISMGIALGFIFYCLVKVLTGKAKEIHPILWGSTALFLLYFVFMAIQ